VIEIRPGLELSGYVLDVELGHGGMGVVYRAHEPLLARQVALKLIRTDVGDPEVMRQRFMIEARAGAAIDHPNVVQVYSVGQAEDVLYIAMQLIDGPSLGDVLRKEVFVEPVRAVDIVCQIASVLAVAHERGLVHRDVKPRNILLHSTGDTERAFLADFGLARFVAVSGLTKTTDSIGTPAYMAPEQVKNDQVDGRADIYALGCVLHHALTGEEPFPRAFAHEIYGAHLHADPPLPSACNSSLGTDFDEVVLQALAKSPEDRFPSCKAFENACRDALGRTMAEPAAETGTSGAAISIPQDVLVWQDDGERPLIHRTGGCSVLSGRVVPPPSIAFAGPGTAGWLTFGQAVQQPAAALCGVCTLESPPPTEDVESAAPTVDVGIATPDTAPAITFTHDRGGRDTVFVLANGDKVRTGAAGTRCFRDIAAQFSENDALATARQAIEVMPEVIRVTPGIRQPQVRKGESPLVTEAFLVAGGLPHERAHELGQRVYRSGRAATADLRSEGFWPPASL
jgi:serine/threonine-protein kinase